MTDQDAAAIGREAGGQVPATRQLRLALGMRGGVSLAVWIGGACAEIEALRLGGLRLEHGDAGGRGEQGGAGGQGEQGGGPTNASGASFYERLLKATGFDGVQVDVLAGASAGGLNGALLASSLVYGVDFAGFRNVWLEVAGLRELLRSRDHPPPSSIMRGEYFLEEMKKRLGEALESRDRVRPAVGYVDLHLAATVTSARPVAVTDDEAGWYGEETYRAGFRFRHNRHTSDFVTPPDWLVDDDVARAVVGKLALAARSSSSFPAAFAPAEIDVERPEDLVGRRADPGAPGDLFGLFSDPSRTKAWVVDGGVLDNIPVTRAIQSIAEAPADRATERWLLYLSPSPEDVAPDMDPKEGTTWDGEGTPDLIWTIKAVMRAAGSRESILEDMEALRAHNDLADRYRAARDLLVGRIRRDSAVETAQTLWSAAAEGAEVFERGRAARAATRTRALLEDPVEALGEDTLPASVYPWPLHRDLESQWPWALRQGLERALREAYTAQLEGAASADTPEDAAALGPYPVTRAARYLIGTIGKLERRADADTAARLGSAKQVLYALAGASDLLSHMGELFWPVYFVTNPPVGAVPPDAAQVSSWATQGVQARRDFLAGAAQEAPGSAAAQNLAARFAWLREELRRRLAAIENNGSWQGAPDLVAWLWARLADEVVDLAGLVAGAAVDPDSAPDLAAGLGVLAHIHATDEAEPPAALRSLVALEVVVAPLARISPSPPQPIRFTRLSGANPSPLDWPKLFPPPPDGGSPGRVDVQAKLNGNELANFAAFYKRSWRANDWMWGRLDAVGTVLRIALRPDEIRDRLRADPDGVKQLHAAVAAIVTAPFTAVPGLTKAQRAEWDQRFAALWADAEADVEEELEALAGDRGGELTATRTVLTARRHWEIVAAELPCVLDAREVDKREAKLSARGVRGVYRRRRAERKQARKRKGVLLATPKQVEEVLATYDVGRETIVGDLGSDHLTRLLADAARGTLAAVRHSQQGKKWYLLGVADNLVADLHWALVNTRVTRRIFRLGKRKEQTG